MKLFCRCDEEWIYPDVDVNTDLVNQSRQVLSGIPANCECKTRRKWYNADYENMMFDLKEMNL